MWDPYFGLRFFSDIKWVYITRRYMNLMAFKILLRAFWCIEFLKHSQYGRFLHTKNTIFRSPFEPTGMAYWAFWRQRRRRRIKKNFVMISSRAWLGSIMKWNIFDSTLKLDLKWYINQSAPTTWHRITISEYLKLKFISSTQCHILLNSSIYLTLDHH